MQVSDERLISDENLRGRTVIAADGQAIGEVGALLIDISAWGVAALHVKLRKAAAEQIGAARGVLRGATLDIPVRLIQSVGDAVLLSAPTQELQHLLSEGGDR
jgi:sporulation protein YlmC with PRC-barrel domain